MNTLPNTRELARGKWQSILPRLGIAADYLTGRHKPCPICDQGKDRFRFDDKEGFGTWICNTCSSDGNSPSAGDGFTLLMRFHGWDYARAAKEVDGVLNGGIPNVPLKRPGLTPEEIRQRLNSMWTAATDSSVVEGYLRSRGLSVIPACLRGHPRLSYRFESTIGSYPAMLARITDQHGRPVSIHRTYIGNLPERKLTCPPLGTIKGAAIRLFTPTNGIALTEGIENAIAVHELFGVPAWATVSSVGMQSVILPASCKFVAIFGDRDDSFTGQAAAFALAKRLKTEGRQVTVHFPPKKSGDWLDVLNSTTSRTKL